MSGMAARWFAACGDRVVLADDAGAEATLPSALARGRAVLQELPPRRCLVFLKAENTVACVSVYLALLDAGHPVLLIDNELSGPAAARLVAVYQPDAVVSCGPHIRVEINAGPANDALHPDLSVLLSTSGSTGSPKLARFSLPKLMANASSIVEYLRLSPDERPVLMLPFHYSFGLSVLHSHLLCGARVELTQLSILQGSFWDRVSRAAGTSFSGVPFHYEAMRRLGPARIAASGIRTWTQAGGRLSPEHVRFWAAEMAASGKRFYVMYGQTEAGPRISYLDPADLPQYADSIGRPIPGVELILLDDAGAAIARSETVGELVCKSPSIMMGYAVSRADLSVGDVMNGTLHTGDLARKDSEGRFYICGRKSRFVKLMGVRVALDDIEEMVRSLGMTAAVAGKDDLVVVAIEGGSAEDVESVRRKSLESFRFPPRALRVILTEQLPRGPGGKVLYGELLAASGAGA
jgi:long-chain acyl-CoA synthetase